MKQYGISAGQFRQSGPSSVGRNGPRFARIDPRNGEIERPAPRRAALLPAGDRGPGGRGSGAAGDPLSPARHAGKQERSGAAASGGLQDPAREDQAVRHFRGTVPAVLTVASGRRLSGGGTMVYAP